MGDKSPKAKRCDQKHKDAAKRTAAAKMKLLETPVAPAKGKR